jgi:hypothetical protein
VLINIGYDLKDFTEGTLPVELVWRLLVPISSSWQLSFSANTRLISNQLCKFFSRNQQDKVFTLEK